MSELLRIVSVVLLASCAGPSSAVNKCTGSDGKVIYQEAACASSAKAERIQIAPGPRAAEGRWSFARQKDSMTGEETCFAASPTTYLLSRPQRYAFATVFLQLSASANGGRKQPLITVRSWESGDGAFHNDITGTGLRVDELPFVPLAIKYGSHVLGLREESTSALLGQLDAGRAFRVRLRFWPYDQLVDSKPIPLDGYKQAMAAFQRCLEP